MTDIQTDLSLKLRVTLAVLALFLLALWSMAVLAPARLRADLIDRQSRSQMEAVSYVASHIESEVGRRFDALRVTAAHLKPDWALRPRGLEPQLESSASTVAGLFKKGLFIAAPDGGLVAGMEAAPRAAAYPDAEFWRRLRESARPAIDRPRLAGPGETPSLVFAVPLFDDGNRVIGALAGSVTSADEDMFGALASGGREANTAFLLSSPRDKVFVAASDPGRIMRPLPEPGANKQNDRYMAGHEESGIAVSSRGVEELSSARHVPGTGWIVIGVMPTTELFAPVSTLRRVMIVLAALWSIVVSSVVWWYLRRSLRPLETLAERIDAIDDDENASRLDESGSSELRTLIRHFNDLHRRLAERHAHQIARIGADYEALVENAPVGMFRADGEGRLLFVNRHGLHLLGYASEELLGGAWLKVVHPDDREAARFLALNPADRSGESQGELRVRTGTGEERWIACRVTSLPGDDAGYIGSFADITRQKIGEDLAAALAAENHAILENAPVAICMLRNRRIVNCNRAFENMFGYARGELPDISIRDLYLSAPDSRRVDVGAQEDSVERRVRFGEIQLRHRDGTTFWGSIGGGAIDPENPGGGSIWVCLDITERKLVEDELRKYERAVTQCPVSIVVTDTQGVIEYVNPAFTRITGYAAHEALGQNPRLLQSGETPAHVYRELWATISSGREWRGVLRNRRKNGEPFWEEAAIAPVLDAEGRIVNYLATKEDISSRRAAEDELDRYRRNLEAMVVGRTQALSAALKDAQVAEKAKDEFLANMSHEIRTPLNAIIGMSGLALRTELDGRQRDYVEKIHGAGELLLGVINDVLDLSKITAGRMKLDEEDFALADQIARLNSVLGARATEKGLRLSWSIAPDVPVFLKGDALRLSQVLMNLIGNAIKFTERGQVQLDVGVAERGERHVQLRFAVADSGIGMSEEEMGRLFQPFSQADSSVTRKYGGTGLGLAICKRLVEMMGGRIGVRSRAGVGSVFEFSARFGPGVEPEGRDDLGADWTDFGRGWRFDGARILVADDQAMNRQIAVELLRALGATVDTVENGREAVDQVVAAGSGGYDLVLMDIQMPEVDGLSATREIRAREEHAGLPVVAMTAHVLEEERRRCREAGMNDHIGKPFNPNDLVRMLATWLPADKRRKEGPEAKPDEAAQPEGGGTAYPGFDVESAVRRFGGKLERYREWLETFARDQAGAGEEIRGLLEAGDWTGAGKRVHTLKGQSGTLGMTRLHAAAAELETEVRALRRDSDCLERFTSALQHAVTTIVGAAPAVAVSAPLSPTTEITPPEIAHLLALLKRGDGGCEREALRCIDALTDPLWRARIQATLPSLRRFDFDAAAKIVMTNPQGDTMMTNEIG